MPSTVTLPVFHPSSLSAVQSILCLTFFILTSLLFVDLAYANFVVRSLVEPNESYLLHRLSSDTFPLAYISNVWLTAV